MDLFDIMSRPFTKTLIKSPCFIISVEEKRCNQSLVYQIRLERRVDGTRYLGNWKLNFITIKLPFTMYVHA